MKEKWLQTHPRIKLKSLQKVWMNIMYTFGMAGTSN